MSVIDARHRFAPLVKCKPAAYPAPVPDGVSLLPSSAQPGCFALTHTRRGVSFEVTITRKELDELLAQGARLLMEGQ